LVIGKYKDGDWLFEYSDLENSWNGLEYLMFLSRKIYCRARRG